MQTEGWNLTASTRATAFARALSIPGSLANATSKVGNPCTVFGRLGAGFVDEAGHSRTDCQNRRSCPRRSAEGPPGHTKRDLVYPAIRNRPRVVGSLDHRCRRTLSGPASWFRGARTHNAKPRYGQSVAQDLLDSHGPRESRFTMVVEPMGDGPEEGRSATIVRSASGAADSLTTMMVAAAASVPISSTLILAPWRAAEIMI